MSRQPPSGQRPPYYGNFTITLRHTTLSRTPLDERSARRRDLYLYNKQHSQHTFMPSGGIRTQNPNKQTGADPRLWLRGHWGRHENTAFYFSTGATTHCGFVFCSRLAGYSLLAYEVSWSHTTVGRTPPDEWSARRRENTALYLYIYKA